MKAQWRHPQPFYFTDSRPPGYKIRVGDLPPYTTEALVTEWLSNDWNVSAWTFDAICKIDVKQRAAHSGASYCTITVTNRDAAERLFRALYDWSSWVEISDYTGYRKVTLRWLSEGDVAPRAPSRHPRPHGYQEASSSDPVQTGQTEQTGVVVIPAKAKEAATPVPGPSGLRYKAPPPPPNFPANPSTWMRSEVAPSASGSHIRDTQSLPEPLVGARTRACSRRGTKIVVEDDEGAGPS